MEILLDTLSYVFESSLFQFVISGQILLIVPLVVNILVAFVLLAAFFMNKRIYKTFKLFFVSFLIGIILFIVLNIGPGGGDMVGIFLVFSGWIIFGIVNIITLIIFLYERRSYKIKL